MAPDAQLRFVHTGIGLVPGFGGLGRLRALVGRGEALRIIASREEITASEAVRRGLATEIVPVEGLRGYAARLAEHIAEGDARAVALAKRALTAKPTARRREERQAFLGEAYRRPFYRDWYPFDTPWQPESRTDQTSSETRSPDNGCKRRAQATSGCRER